MSIKVMIILYTKLFCLKIKFNSIKWPVKSFYLQNLSFANHQCFIFNEKCLSYKLKITIFCNVTF